MFRNELAFAKWVLIGFAVWLTLPAATAFAGHLEALVPAYFYPVGNSYWADMTTAAATIPLDAILNPNSGPGTMVDPNYLAAVTGLRGAGGKVLGYVHTSYGARSLAAVAADIATYRSFYPIDGFFIDEMSTSTAPGILSYYGSIYSYIKGLNPGYRVIGNPGTNTDPAYLTQPAADSLVIFEDTSANYATFSPSAWVNGYSPDHFGNIIHTAGIQDLSTDLNLAVARNAALVFVTDATLPNPYDQLPSYWDQEVALIAAIDSVPEPATLALAVTGALVFLGWRWGWAVRTT